MDSEKIIKPRQNNLCDALRATSYSSQTLVTITNYNIMSDIKELYSYCENCMHTFALDTSIHTIMRNRVYAWYRIQGDADSHLSMVRSLQSSMETSVAGTIYEYDY